MSGWIKRIHIYAGLLTFSHLMIYGIAGLAATFHVGPERPKTPGVTREVPFAIPASATDRQVAELVHRTLNLPLTRPMPDWYLRRTPENHLLLDFHNINGIFRVVVIENEGKLRIEEIRNSAWLFLEDIHAATPADRQAPRPLRAWAWWNEIAMWSLLGFCVTGVYLWLAARPSVAWAWCALAAGAACFASLWAAMR